jgi:hypothetical protein
MNRNDSRPVLETSGAGDSLAEFNYTAGRHGRHHCSHQQQRPPFVTRGRRNSSALRLGLEFLARQERWQFDSKLSK